MKRTVYNTMIGLMLASGLAMTSTGAMAQGRRPASTSSAAAAGNRSVATVSPKNNAAVSNSSSSVRSSMSSVSARPSTSSAVSTSPRTSSSASSIRPSVGGSNSSTINRSSGSNSTVNRSTGSSSVNRSTGSTGTITSNAGNRSAVRPSTSNVSSTISTSSGSKGSGNNGNARPSVGGSNSGNSSGSSTRPNVGGGNTGKGHSTAPTRRPSTGTPRPKVGGTVMAGGGPSIDYNTYRYSSSWRPRYDGDRFFNSFRHNSWSWRNPIRPSVRQWRPSTMWVYRPIVTININRYSSYPTIAGVLGLRWGTSFINSLNYLYYSGYEIDGFENNIVYLTDVELMDYAWDDVMLQFDGNDNLDYVEFAFWNYTYDTSRFYSLYHTLCSIYGSPVSYDNSMYSWYGGDGIGYVNLGMQYGTDVCYTVLAFGV